MKKLVLSLLLMSMFSVLKNEVSAQNGVTKLEFSFESGYYMPCIDEWIMGMVTLELKIFKHSYQVKTSGDLTSSDGSVYSLKSIQNSDFSLDKLILTTIFTDEWGQPAFKIHVTSQIHYNASGELTAVVDNVVSECY